MNIADAANLINSTIDFSVTGTALGTQNFKSIKVLGILDFSTAQGISQIYQDHALIYPSLPIGTPNNPEKYNYIKIQLPDGKVRAIGLPWIVDDSVRLHDVRTLTLTLNRASQADADRVRAYMLSNNRTDFTIDLS
jgi:hypothetical protein